MANLKVQISIHALCEEGDPRSRSSATSLSNFYPRPLRGGRPVIAARRPPSNISIHALCEEGDCRVCLCKAPPGNFYPRPLRGGRPHIKGDKIWTRKFLSTPSARRATSRRVVDGIGPRGISIHALCEEGDGWSARSRCPPNRFLSTPSARRATSRGMVPSRVDRNFYPRPLRGGRPLYSRCSSVSSRFLSTPSARRATHRGLEKCVAPQISIHALCEEGDAVPRNSP